MDNLTSIYRSVGWKMERDREARETPFHYGDSREINARWDCFELAKIRRRSRRRRSRRKSSGRVGRQLLFSPSVFVFVTKRNRDEQFREKSAISWNRGLRWNIVRNTFPDRLARAIQESTVARSRTIMCRVIDTKETILLGFDRSVKIYKDTVDRFFFFFSFLSSFFFFLLLLSSGKEALHKASFPGGLRWER